MTKEIKLKPCPFCGSDDLDVHLRDEGVHCRGCGAWMPSVYSSDHSRTHGGVEGWNRRAEIKTKPLKAHRGIKTDMQH